MRRPVTIGVIFAHPDDEAFGVAGTCAKYAAQGAASALLCVTAGEAGMTGGLADSQASLAALRRAELECAGQVMGLADLRILNYADGGAATWDRAALAEQITAFLGSHSPSVVITFDPNGITRHPDHIATHEVVRQVVLEAGPALGVRRLYYQVVTCPEEASPEGPALACVSPADVNVTVDVSAFEAAKRAALRCHATQAEDTANMLSRPDGSLAAEHYQLAWSDAGWRPAAGEEDLLAGLFQ